MTTRTRTTMVLFGATLLLAACAETAETPTTPSSAAKAPRAPILPRGTLSSVNGNLVVVQDENDGTLYTFDADARRMTTSDGYSIVMDDTQAATLYSYFLAIAASDAAIEDIQGACVPETCGTVNAQAVLNGAPTTEPFYISVSDKVFGQKLNVYQEDTKKPKKLKTSGALSFALEGYCSDIITSVAGNRLTWGTKRTAGIKSLVFGAMGEGLNFGLDFILPPGTVLGASVFSSFTDVVHAHIGLSMMQVMWNSHNCGDRNVIVGPIWVPGGGPTPTPGGTGATGGTQCWYTQEQMSFNNQDWFWVTVKYCPSMT